MGMRRVRELKMVGAALVTLAAMLSLGGCYERVVGAKGLGSDRIKTEEPYQQDTELDRWIYGPGGTQPK